ncbi:MAG: hypothetical protein BZY64_01765, partial [SAR202 cluster bacterium Ae2-Chloro-G1]
MGKHISRQISLKEFYTEWIYMIVRVSRITLILPSRSLKEKRGILKSVIERVSNRFKVSIAEVDSNDMPDIGVLGLAVVSTKSRHAESVLNKSIMFLENSRPDVEVS